MPRPVDPSEFADVANPTTGPRRVDPSEFAEETQPQQTPQLSKAERGDVSATAQPGFFQSLRNIGQLGLSDWRQLAAMGVRGTAGVLGAEGGVPGSLITGGGEAAAQLVGGEDFSPTRIGTEAAFGAIPFRKVVQGGKLATSALRSGALSAGREAVGEGMQGGIQNVDPRKVAEAGGFGALAGAFGAKISKAAPEVAQDATTPPAKPAIVKREEAGTTVWTVPRSPETRPQGAVPTAAQAKYQEDVRSSLTKALGVAEKTAAKQQAATEKLSQQAQAQSAIAEAIKNAGLEKKGISVGESLSAPTEGGGKITMRTRYGVPEEEELQELSPGAQARYDEAKTRVLAEQEQPKTGPTSADGGFQAQPSVGPTEPQPPAPSGFSARPPVQAPSAPATAPNEAIPGTSEARARVASPSSSEQPPTGEPAEPSALEKFLKPSGVSESVLPEPPVGTAPEDWEETSRSIAEASYQSPEVDRIRALLSEKLGPAAPEQPRARSAKPVSSTPVSAPGPESPAPSTTGTTPDWVAKQSAIADAAAKDPDFLAALKKIASEEKGFADPSAISRLLQSPAIRTRLATTGLGALGGGVLGAEASDEPVEGGLKGAALGALLGTWTSPVDAARAGESLLSKPAAQEMLKNLVDVRRASFLASLGPITKKALIDPAGTISEGLTQMLPGDYGDPRTGRALVKAGAGQYLSPQAWKDFWNSMGAEDIGSARGIYERASSNPLGWVHLPLEGIQGMTEKTAARAGASPEAIGRITGSGLPETETGRQALQFIQKHPVLQLLQPFSKVPIHIAESVRNVPGIAQYLGGVGASQRAKMGAASMALGALEQLYNQQSSEGGEPVSPLAQVAQSGAMGIPYVVPNVLGKAITAYLGGGNTDAIRELINLFPGGHLAPDQPYPGETTEGWVNRQAKRQINAMAPSGLAIDPGVGR